MKRNISIFLSLMLCLYAFKAQAQAQNLLAGWDNTGGTPYDAGWRVDGNTTVTWGTLNGSGNRYRTGVGSPANNGDDPMLYITVADTKFGYPVNLSAEKFYKLSGKAWRRNGSSGSAAFNFYLADNLLATNPVSMISLTLSGNNVVNTFSERRLVAPAGFTAGYFLFDVHNNSGSWNEAGVWLMELTELGDAIAVTFNTDGGSAVAAQYFLDGEDYTITQPADPTKEDGSPFGGWYADEDLNALYDFATPVTSATTIYAKWEDVSAVKEQLTALISVATEAKTGGTEQGQTYLQSAIDEAQAVVDEASSTISDCTAAISALNDALAVYRDNSLSELKVNGTAIAGFSSATDAYTYNLAPGASDISTVSATATATSVASVAVTQAAAVQGAATVEVTAGDGSAKTYTVNFIINYMSGWDGNGMGTTSDVPSAFGWACSNAVTWVDASDGNDAYAYRYRDNFGSGVGRVITHPANNNVFSFPVNLTGGKVYRFSCRNSNLNGTCTAAFGINTSSDATGTMLGFQSLTSARWSALTTFSFYFGAAETGTCYMVWQTTNGYDRNIAADFLITEVDNAQTVTFDTDGGSEVTAQYFAEGDDYMVVEPADPAKDGLFFVGWYTDNAYTTLFDFNSPVTESVAIYARFVTEDNIPITDITYNDEIVTIQAAGHKNITVNGNSELHISADDPLVNSVINLTSDNAWLYLESVRPSKVVSDYLSHIRINGQAFNPENDRIAIYGSGTVIIPYGKTHYENALTVYTGENFTGESKSYEINTYHRELGDFDNSVQSFKLKKGFSATLANNPDGTGFSRVFIAGDEDIEIAEMSEGMEGFVSFIRVFKWEWTGKKGWAGGIGTGSQLNVSISYDWDAAGNTENIDAEYVPMRHNLGWQSFDVINARNNVSHVLGYNEPDRSDQSNMSVEDAIEQWPELFKSGLRLGSPAPASTNGTGWLNNFMNLCDELNYRVDFIVTHAYQYQNTGWWDWYIDLTSRGNRSIEEAQVRRPVWITEWNNGANWTSESWPTASGPQRDADLNLILDADGNEITVNKPLSPENSAQSVTKMEQLLPYFDSYGLLEHHFLYNWVQDARSMELGGMLTPAGKYFAAYKSKPGFSKANEYIHRWKIAPPLLSYTLSANYQTVNISWYDHNGETGKYYVLERKFDNESDYSVIATLNAEEDYTYGGTVTCTDNVTAQNASYRVKAMSYKDTESAYSRVVSFVLDAVITSPADLQGTAVSSSIIDLSWTAVSDARSYNLKRSSSIDGTYETIATFLADTQFRDEALAVNTTYYYKVSAVNNRGETDDSGPVTVTTRAITIPAALTGLFASVGDTKAVITWDYRYDAQFRVSRAESENGTYVVVADNLTGARYEDTGLTNGVTYYYKVASFNAAGTTVAGTILRITPVASQYAYFNFDESAGDTTHDLWGGYHGTLYNNAAFVSGQTNTAASFTAADQSYVHLRDGLTSELDDFTISLWVNFTSKGSRIFDLGESTGVFMMLSPGLRYKITCPDGTYDVTASGHTLPTGEWTHLALTQEGATFKMYMNGTEIFSDNNATVKPSDMGTNTQNFLVRSHWNSDSYSTCLLDEFRIYGRALSAGEVNALMNGSIYAAELSASALTLHVGDTRQLSITSVFPDNADASALSWRSDNTGIAGVSNGLVSAVSPGTTYIRLINDDGDILATCHVTVESISVSYAELSESALTLHVGDTHQLSITFVYPDNADASALSWRSDNTGIAGVSNGLVSAVSPGTTYIRLINDDGDILATCRVNVETPNANETIDNSKVTVFVKDHVLYIESPYKETVEVYNLAGQLLSKKDKPAGSITLTVADNAFIVRGSAGWSKKIIH